MTDFRFGPGSLEALVSDEVIHRPMHRCVRVLLKEPLEDIVWRVSEECLVPMEPVRMALSELFEYLGDFRERWVAKQLLVRVADEWGEYIFTMFVGSINPDDGLMEIDLEFARSYEWKGGVWQRCERIVRAHARWDGFPVLILRHDPDGGCRSAAILDLRSSRR
jgi:hypothetical protein